MYVKIQTVVCKMPIFRREWNKGKVLPSLTVILHAPNIRTLGLSNEVLHDSIPQGFVKKRMVKLESLKKWSC